MHPEIIIKPIRYYVNPENLQQELYMTPYYYQARCIGVETEKKGWGIYGYLNQNIIIKYLLKKN